MKPFVSVTTSVPVVRVTLRAPTVAAASIVMFAVAVVGELTVRVLTVIPAPRLAVVVPCTKFVNCAVMATDRFCCPCWAELGFTSLIPCTVSIPIESACWFAATAVAVLEKTPTEEPALRNPIVKLWLALIVPKLQFRSWLPTAPVMAHVPGPLYTGLMLQFTLAPAGSGSFSVDPLTAPPALLLTVIVNPIGLPACTGVLNGKLVSVKLPTFAGGNATTTSLNCFVRAVIRASTFLFGS